MANYIVVSTHRRPECLWLCLESLKRCRGIEKYPLYVAMNENSDPEISGVVKKLWQGLTYELAIRPADWLAERANGEAIKVGALLSDDFFFWLAEDDLVSRDYLELGEYVAEHLRGERLLCVHTASVTEREDYPDAGDELLIRSQIFHSIAPVIFKEPFERYVKDYLCEEFYQTETLGLGVFHSYNPDFLNKCFPDQNFLAFGVDGILKRVIAKYGLYTLASVVPRSHTIGFYGVHLRGLSAEGMKEFRSQSLELRVALLKDAIKTGTIKEFFGKWGYLYQRIEDDHSWRELGVTDCRVA